MARQQEEAVILEGPCGDLEALYLDGGDAPRKLALICHPNPVKGGTMQNKVTSTLQRTARDHGYTTLRFNYRGVGASAGSHDMQQGEVDDAEAALQWLLARHPGCPVDLFGFSFGGFVAASLSGRLEAAGIRVGRLFMVAPAVMRLDDQPLARDCVLTIIQPEQDEVIPPEAVYAYSGALQQAHELIRVPDCSHFFHGQLVPLRDLVAARL